jgi:hypothetical protein
MVLPNMFLDEDIDIDPAVPLRKSYTRGTEEWSVIETFLR